MESRLAQVMHDYATLASELIDRWEEHASKAAERIDAGTYDADAAVSDLAKCASLAAESGFLLASEAFDAAAILAAGRLNSHIVCSDSFSTSLPGASLSVDCPPTNGFGSKLSLITLEPAQLDPGATEFRLRADATGRTAGTYVGNVEAATAAGQTESVLIWITVP
jgi:hypothetical protein